MAEKLTPQQELAVKNRGGRLLVSAAAGSGKTKVLVDRLLSYLTDPQDPANVDEFLIITYTKAAASELRGKIAAKLSERIAEDPENRHLQRQLQRLYLAKISTVHAFCGDILREYAWRLDLAADFRVADENECRQIRDTVIAQLLDEAYASVGEDPEFRSFVDTQGLGRDDRLVPEILLKVYDSARCHLDPEKWLQTCVDNAAVDTDDIGNTVWGQYLMADLMHYLDLQIEAMGRCASLAAQADGMAKPALLLNQILQQLVSLRESRCWDDVVRHRDVDFGRLVISKKCDQELGEGIKAVRAACKKGLEKKLRAFTDESSLLLADMRRSADAVRGMVKLARAFGTAYDKVKRSHRILDFGDLEHRMLDLLLGTGRSGPTAAAAEIESRFRDIMVDEYQDSNAVQDAIFTALTRKRHNCFMVGDVKQSIYQFRLADPSIFLEKYNTYADAEKAADGEGRRVLLSSNFRSGGAVLAGVNDIFKACMSPEVGGLHYGEEEALREGIPHTPLGEPEVELLTLDVQANTYPEEAAMVADRIVQLLDGTHFVRDGDGLRPIKPEDIAILLRSPGSAGGYFRSALESRGLRCVSGGGEDLLQTAEVSTLRALLQTIANPRQDIPLIAVLASPVFGFTADDLATFRAKRRYGCVYDALAVWESAKATEFIKILTALRRASQTMTLEQLLEDIFVQTRMVSIYAAMENGTLRETNLQTFYSLAVDFASAGRRDLAQFLEFLDSLEEKGLIAAGEQTAAGAVTLMSIHKSKGLEFPVVFVSNLSREFNRESVRAQVLCDKELGLGLTAVDPRNRIRFPTVAKRAIALKTVQDSLSEELRVLYVALTRARDRLIMTYASGTLEKDLADIASRMDLSHRELMTRDVVCPGQWVLLAALQRTEAGELFALGGKPRETTPGEPAWKIRVLTAPQQTEEGTFEDAPIQKETVDLTELRRGLAFRYGHDSATRAPSKQTATQRKGREKDAEAAEDTHPPKPWQHKWRKPSFAGGEAAGKDYGSAMHKALQFLPFGACTDESAIQQELQKLILAGFLTEAEAELVDCGKLAAFFATDLGKKLRTHQTVLREFKFSILDDGEHFEESLWGEQILLQGVVDCAILEDDGITVVDFKTDRVTEGTLPEKLRQYRPQVLAYAGALERIYGKPVKESCLYFFALDRLVSLEE